jgi:predicted GNAT superfamily acetyltransferase
MMVQDLVKLAASLRQLDFASKPDVRFGSEADIARPRRLSPVCPRKPTLKWVFRVSAFHTRTFSFAHHLQWDSKSEIVSQSKLQSKPMTTGWDIAVATSDDLPGILALQDANQPDRGGILSARFPQDWILAAIAKGRVIVARRDAEIAGYVFSGELASQANVPVVQAMLRAYAPPPNAFLYGPVCVAQSERGQGLAGALFDELRARFAGRDCITFIRRDNLASRQAHAKMGMTEVAAFTHDGAEQLVVVGFNLA